MPDPFADSSEEQLLFRMSEQGAKEAAENSSTRSSQRRQPQQNRRLPARDVQHGKPVPNGVHSANGHAKSSPHADSPLQDNTLADDQSAGQRLPEELPLQLLVRDREVIESLLDRPMGSERQTFALDALKIGIVALRHAAGRVDADLLRRETSRLLETLGQTLDHHATTAHERVNGALKEYFDPQNGRFHERVQLLVSQDGELSRLLREQLDGDNSRLSQTLMQHVGKESPLMKILDPQQSQGLLVALNQTVEGQLHKQSEQVLKEFSLDNEQGALARLVKELTTKHGDLTEALHTKIDDVVKEFSLDEENSALSRLVRNVDHAQRTISNEFSLDNEHSAFSRLNRMLEATQGAIHKSLTLDEADSPLARLKRELWELFHQAEEKNRKFQEEVQVSLAKMTAQQKEAERSTRHGEQFEEAVVQFLIRESQSVGDVATPTGATTGRIKNCKVGDCVIELGPDCPAAGEKIVIEAKQKEGYTLEKARLELETARNNRDAVLGVFVFSKRLAPVGLENFQRFGNDIICIWDAEDPSTDVFLKAALITARALSFRRSSAGKSHQTDFDAIDSAVLQLEKHAANLGQVRTWAQTIQNSADKILNRVDLDERAFEKQLGILREKLHELRSALGGDA